MGLYLIEGKSEVVQFILLGFTCSAIVWWALNAAKTQV